MNMRNYIKAALLVFLTCTVSAFAQQPAQEFSEVSSAPGRATLTSTATASAIVETIDTPSRKLTLRLADGRRVDMVADKEVRNFDQIKVGDELRVESMSTIVLQRKPGGKALKEEEKIDMTRAKPGQKPGGVITYKARMLTDVVGVNKEKKTITLKQPDGKLVVLNVKNPEQFDVVKVGNQVEIDYVETLAIAVTQPSIKDGKK